jgi:hypothetical protein
VLPASESAALSGDTDGTPGGRFAVAESTVSVTVEGTELALPLLAMQVTG